MVSTIVSIPGYRISEELYNGSRTMVYRGYRETDSLPVVIKLLKNPYPSFSELLSFRNQYTIAKNLNSPLIIQTYSLELYQNGYALVMEDFGGISLKDYFTSVETGYIASLQEFLEIAIALCNTLDEIVKTGAVVNTITLQPLSLVDLNQLVSDTLNCELSLAQPLTELVYQKTQGNPFFATQFLKALHEDQHITFDPPQSPSPLSKGGRQGGWQCDIAQVRALAITDDVVEFMALQLQKLPVMTQNILKLAACIGAQFEMSALGNLVAGVAHEMNNPLGFISASLQQAKHTVADIVEHLKLYQKILPNPGDEIKDHAEDIDLDYSLSDLPKIIDSMVMACDRLKNISTSLRTFSRADQNYKVPFNIHEGIDSTILILKHRLKANQQRPAIEVINNYGNLPQVECFPGQLNQVFMNILANAIDALDESNTGRSFEEIKHNPNQITIKTSVENKGVKIAIADNGQGINEEVKQKIFDHLFTTKGVGKGTGLGLAIARQIVEEKHGGVIQVDSRLSEGTEFVIQLPV